MDDTQTIWLGTQGSHEKFVMAQTAVAAQMLARASAGGDMEEPSAELLQVQGNVGIVHIKGSLIPGRAGFMKYYGQTGYDDIKEALIAAAQHQDVRSIVLNIGSGGGHVAGVQETANLISRLDKIKPIITYTGENMASAALWMGSAGRRIFVAQTAEVGSLGVLMVHKEYSEALKANGIKYTIVRAGKYKAEVNPYEPLSDGAKTRLEAQAEYFYGIFLNTVAEGRGVSPEAADKAFGQGREFIGQQAVTAGLADEVGSFEDAYTYAQKLADKALAKAAKSAATPNTTGYSSVTNNASLQDKTMMAGVVLNDNPATAQGTNMPTPLMTDDQLRAIAASAGIVVTDPAAAQTPEQIAAATAAATAATAAAAATASAAALAAPAAAATEPSALVVLQGMLTSAQADLGARGVELVAAKAAVATAEAAVTAAKAEVLPFVAIARASVKTMAVALNQEVSADTLDAVQVLAEHTRLSGIFQAKFKSGGVAASAATQEAAKPAALSPAVAALFKQTAK